MIGCGEWGRRKFPSWNRCYNSLGRENRRSMLDGRSRKMSSFKADEFELPGYPNRDAEYTGENTCLVIQNIGKKCKWKNHRHLSNAETCHKRCVQHQRICCKVENVKGKEKWRVSRTSHLISESPVSYKLSAWQLLAK